MENTYQNPPAAPKTPQEQKFQKRYVKERSVHPKSSPMRAVLAVLGLLGFFVVGLLGVLISQRQYQDPGPVAPTAPESVPEAFINQAVCTLTFTVPSPTPTPEPNECGYSPCDTDNDCQDDLICVIASDGLGYCAQEAYEEACYDDPSVTTCCQEPTPTPTPTPTPEPMVCGERGCTSNFDCDGDLICVTADNGNNYCAQSEYRAACEDSPTTQNCCQEPSPTPTPTPTPTPSGTPTPTPTPGSSTASTPSATITVSGGQPDFPDELPQSGPADWLRYLQAGLAALGIGALLLLML